MAVQLYIAHNMSWQSMPSDWWREKKFKVLFRQNRSRLAEKTTVMSTGDSDSDSRVDIRDEF